MNDSRSPSYKHIAVDTALNVGDFNLELLDKLSHPAPLYKLRTLETTHTDDSTDQKDLWLSPLPTDTIQPLTHFQIKATLDYFLMCSERLRQMNKTYKDIDAVSELLDEKEKDLELAARIGQSLLERNGDLQTRTEFLEEQLGLANECVTQLRHEINLKAGLLQSMADQEDSNASTPDKVDMQLLQSKVLALEHENANLKLEAAHLKILTQGLEAKEQQLVHDCLKQMEEANKKVVQLSVDLSKKSEECASNNREVIKLLKDVSELKLKEKNTNMENEDLSVQLRAAQETQAGLAREILELQERYSDVLAMLNEAQDELKGHRKMANPIRCGSPLADSLYDSLASELEASDSGFSTTPMPSARLSDSLHSQFKSMRNCKGDFVDGATFKGFGPNALCLDNIPPDPSSLCIPCDPSTPLTSTPQSRGSSSTPIYEKAQLSRSPGICDTPRKASALTTPTPVANDSGFPGDVSATSMYDNGMVTTPMCFPPKLCRAPSSESVASLANYPSPPLGEPGRPGTRDLEIALKKINSRRRIELDYQEYRKSKGMPAVASQPVTSLLRALYGSQQDLSDKDVCISRPTLFKPFKGSRTLQQWKALATAAVASPLTPPSHSGICIKCSTKPEIRDQAIMQVNELERSLDEDLPCSSKSLILPVPVETSLDCCLAVVPSITTYSLATSSVRHPTVDVISPTTSPKRFIQDGGKVYAADGTCTYSSGRALAKALKERSGDICRRDTCMTSQPDPPTQLGLRGVGLMMQSMYEHEKLVVVPEDQGVLTRSHMIKQQSSMSRKESGV